MDLVLATVRAVAADGCLVAPLDGAPPLHAGYSRLVVNRIRIRPGQLVALDRAVAPPQIVWRWFCGPITMLADGYAVVDHRPHQSGYRYPLGVVRVPEHLLAAASVGVEAFYTIGHEEPGAIAALRIADRVTSMSYVAAELFPAIEQVYAEE